MEKREREWREKKDRGEKEVSVEIKEERNRRKEWKERRERGIHHTYSLVMINKHNSGWLLPTQFSADTITTRTTTNTSTDRAWQQQNHLCAYIIRVANWQIPKAAGLLKQT